VRPLLPKEEHAGERVCVRVVPSTNQLVLGKDKVFTFDHVLPSKVTQVCFISYQYLNGINAVSSR
jgi:kinesin family member 27